MLRRRHAGNRNGKAMILRLIFVLGISACVAMIVTGLASRHRPQAGIGAGLRHVAWRTCP